VPTLAALLGFPIPFSSLGAAIPGVVYSACQVNRESTSNGGGSPCPCGAQTELESAWRVLLSNAGQVRAYLERYAEASAHSRLPGQSQLPIPSLLAAHDAAAAAAAACGALGIDGPSQRCMEGTSAQLRAFLRSALQACQAFWTEFDVPRMMAGCTCLWLAVLCMGIRPLRELCPTVLGPEPRMDTCNQGLSVGCGLLVVTRLVVLTSNSFMVEEPRVVLALGALAMMVGIRGYTVGPPYPLPPRPPPSHPTHAPTTHIEATQPCALTNVPHYGTRSFTTLSLVAHPPRQSARALPDC
jgi:hypothetical protein